MIGHTSRASFAALLGALLLASPAAAQAPGSLDGSFGSGGIVSVSGTQLLGVAVQSDGRVIAAGTAGGRVLVERFSPSGQPDGTYTGPGGYARAVTIAPNGDIVIAGSVVERLTANLTPDPGFGSGGVAPAPGAANGVAVGPDGSVAVAGTLGGEMAVARYSAGGTRLWTESLGGPNSAGNGVAVQPDGKIVAVGRQTPSQVTNAVVARLNTDGSLDGTFRGGGAFTYYCSGTGYTEFTSVTLQDDGRIVAGGDDAAGPYAVFARFNPDGSADQGFGGGPCPDGTLMPAGQGVTVLGSPIGAYGVGIAGGGRIVGAGGFANTGTAMDAATWALSSSGTPEPTFGSGGTVRGPQATYEACAIAVAPDGSLVSVGDTVTSFPDLAPCGVGGSSSGFVSRRVGFGPPSPPPPPGGPPIVSTGAASGITEAAATVNGQVNPNDLATTYHFDYGITTSYGASTLAGSVGAGTSASTVSATVNGLTPGRTYHFRLVAANADGTTDGGDVTFTTASSRAPGATTGAASNVTEVAATLTGLLNTNGLATTYHFDFGQTASYGSSTRPGSLAAIAGSTVNVSARLTGLRPGTTYHYRLVGHNADGTTYGHDRTFKTLPKVQVRLLGISSSYRIPVVEKRGLVVRVSCNQSCSIGGSLVIPASTAERMHLGRRPVVIGGGAARLPSAGVARLQLELTSKGKSILSSAGQVDVTIAVTARPIAGGPPVNVSRTVTFMP